MKRFIPFLVVLSLSSTILGDVINVPADYTTIQEAIDMAANGDEVVVAEGTYYENIDLLSKDITLRSTNPNDPVVVEDTLIDGGQNDSVVRLGSNEDAVLNGLTIAHGYYDDGGGGIFCGSGSTLMITNCIVRDNSSGTIGAGGGISNYGDIQIDRCIFSRNEAFGDIRGGACGGGIYNGGLMQIANSMFIGNTDWYGPGGGIFDDYEANSTITNCTFVGNSADEGGGLYGYNSIINNCIFRNNRGIDDFNDIGGNVSNSEITYNNIEDIILGVGNINEDPCFVESGYWLDNGTPDNPWDDSWVDGDYHLQDSSPCINTGDPNLIAVGETDIDGQRRIMGQRVDMGADEFLTGEIHVTKPEFGVLWVSGSIHQITWQTYNINGLLDIYFSDNNGLDFSVIEQNVDNTGSFTWSLPDIVDSAQCLVKVLPHSPEGDEIITPGGLFTIHPDSPGPNIPNKWRTLGGDFNRTGLSTDFGPEIGCVKWEFETDGPVSAGVTVGQNCIHIAGEDANLYTLDANGSLLWSYDTNSPIHCSPTIADDGSLYVGNLANRLFAIDKNGGLRWTFDTDGFIYSSPAVSSDGNVFVCSEAGTLYALAPDGSQLWTFQTTGISDYLSGAIMASPAVDANNTVYIPGVYDSNLYALDGSDGSIEWSYHFDSNGLAFTSPVLGDNNNVIYQTLLNDPNLYAINANNGDLLWKTNVSDTDANWFEPYYVDEGTDPNTEYFDVRSSSFSEPVLGPQGTIYVSMDDPYIRAVEPNGTIKWIEKFGELGGFTMTADGNGLVYAASDDKRLYAVSPQGRELARFQGDQFLSYPVIAGDNTLIVSDSNNAVWAVTTDGCRDKPINPHRPQDLNSDGWADLYDFNVLANDWQNASNIAHPDGGTPLDPYYYFKTDQLYLPGDINEDLFVDLYDLAILAEKWLSNN